MFLKISKLLIAINCYIDAHPGNQNKAAPIVPPKTADGVPVNGEILEKRRNVVNELINNEKQFNQHIGNISSVMTSGGIGDVSSCHTSFEVLGHCSRSRITNWSPPVVDLSRHCKRVAGTMLPSFCTRFIFGAVPSR